jgi:UDP-2,3-diacylglucosamine pyrophosphatase LpxH
VEVLEKIIKCQGRSDVWKIYPIGDTHIGCRNCCESHIRELVQTIGKDKKAFWVGGGDLIDAISQGDVRWENDILPDWMLEGDATGIRAKLNDVVSQQRDRAVELFRPIKHKCLGLIEGNHEFVVKKRSRRNIQDEICWKLGVPNLSDEAHIRLTFKRSTASAVVDMVIRHGWGGGRSAGAESNKLSGYMNEKMADLYFSGHTHTADIHRSPLLYMPKGGVLPYEYLEKVRWGGNWGSFVKSAARGASSYASRAGYPPRNLGGIVATIKPFRPVRVSSIKDKDEYDKNVQEFNIPKLKIEFVD